MRDPFIPEEHFDDCPDPGYCSCGEIRSRAIAAMPIGKGSSPGSFDPDADARLLESHQLGSNDLDKLSATARVAATAPSSFEAIVWRSGLAHNEEAKVYERGGNASGAMQLRAVAGLLLGLVRGDSTDVITPSCVGANLMPRPSPASPDHSGPVDRIPSAMKLGELIAWLHAWTAAHPEGDWDMSVVLRVADAHGEIALGGLVAIAVDPGHTERDALVLDGLTTAEEI